MACGELVFKNVLGRGGTWIHIYDPDIVFQPTHNTLIGEMLDVPKIAKSMKGCPFISIEDHLQGEMDIEKKNHLPYHQTSEVSRTCTSPIVQVAPPIRFWFIIPKSNPFLETIHLRESRDSHYIATKKPFASQKQHDHNWIQIRPLWGTGISWVNVFGGARKCFPFLIPFSKLIAKQTKQAK